MPIHDWTKVRANRFHDFHQNWITRIQDALNAGRLPPGYFAMREQVSGGPEPDVVTLHLPDRPEGDAPAGVAVADAPPKVRHRTASDAKLYVRKKDRITVRHPDGTVVAAIEIVSPGNKDSRDALAAFTRKAVAFLYAKVHLLVVDLFPPSKRDPQGIHKAIWDRVREEDFELPADKPLTVASYSVGSAINAYVEPVGVGDGLPDLPVFLSEDRYVPCPLEATYTATWAAFPAPLKGPLEGPPN
ncbi:MAG: DUF4058 family protein [Gemmataceae bacterium]|nr:DUF4058 family protein [Gemmataceae bacterium]